MNELCKDLEQNQKFLELIEDIKQHQPDNHIRAYLTLVKPANLFQQ